MSDTVTISRDEYNALLRARDDLEDMRDAGLAACGIAASTATVAGADMDAYLAAATPLEFWRGKRGLTPAELAASTGLSEPHLEQMELSAPASDVATLVRLAQALTLRADDLVA